MELEVGEPEGTAPKNTQLTIGAVLRALRERIVNKHGKILTQEILYKRCKDVEGLPVDPSKPRTDVSFSATNAGEQRRAISRLENDKRVPTQHEQQILEQVFGVANGFITQVYLTRASVAEAASMQQAAPTTSSVIVARTQTPSSTVTNSRSYGPVDLSGVRTLRELYVGTRCWEPIFKRISSGLEPSGHAHTRVVCLQGKVGVGKTQVIAEWWRMRGMLEFAENVFSRDVSRTAGDRIVRTLAQHFTRVEQEAIDATVVGAINAAKRPLVILDGLVADGSPFDTGEDERTAEGERFTVRRVRRILQDLTQHGARASVLVSIQTDWPSRDILNLESDLDGHSSYEIVQVHPLDELSGAELFSSLGVEGVPDQDLRTASRALLGMPISIVAAANFLRNVDDDDQREEFFARLTSMPAGADAFKSCFDRYLSGLDRSVQEPEAHPHAFLRLLAMMPGPTPPATIERVLSAGIVRRLKRASLNSFRKRSLAFVTELSDGSLELHSQARALLKRELAAVASGERIDEATDRAELAWIHKTLAIAFIEQLPQNTKDFAFVDMASIEGAIYHLLNLKDLLPDDRRGTVLSGRIRLARQAIALRDKIVNDTATDVEITKYALEAIARTYLFDRDHHVTRVLGQFESKARILSYFLDNQPLGPSIRFLGREDQHLLLSEIGICWMHAGRLRLAQRSVARAIRASVQETTQTSQVKWQADLSWTTEPKLRERWISLSESVSTSCLIMMRLGRPADLVESDLAPFLAGAQQVAALILDGRLGVEGNTDLLKGARRIISRSAHIQFSMGNMEAALQGFDRATALERKAKRRWLLGDAGRRHAQALLRHTSQNPHALATAEEIIVEALKVVSPNDQRRRRLSNEIISLMTMRATLFRLRGAFDEARLQLKEIEQHDFLRYGECTFAAHVEYELERARLDIASNMNGKDIAPRLARLVRRLLDAHHLGYAWEAEILAMELLAPAERRVDLTRLARQIVGPGWRLRLRDIDELLAGRSALKTLGV